MPRVPILPTVALNPQGPAKYSAPGVVPVQDQSPRQAMAMGEAFQQAGAQWGAYAADIQRRQDITEAEESLNKVAEDDAKAYSAFRQLDGKAAVNAFEAFDKDQQQRYKLAAERARNDQQRQWIKQKLGDRRVQVFSQAISHRDGQLANYRLGVADAATKQAVQDAVAFMDSPDRQGYLDKVRQRAAEQADLAGVDAEPVARAAISDASEGIARAYLATDRPAEAVQWLEESKVNMDPDQWQKANDAARKGFVEWGARQLDQTVPDFAHRSAVVDEWQAAGRITGDEAESAKRHLAQFETRRMQEDAIQERQLRDDWDKVRAQNPLLRPEDFPDITARAKKLGVVLSSGERQTIPAFETELRRMPMEQLRAMTDDQLRNYLSRGLNKSDENRWFAFVRGDQVSGRLEDDYQRVGRLAGHVDPKSAEFDEWKRNTIDRRIAQERDILKRDLTDAEIRTKVLAPLEVQVKVSDAFTDSTMSMAEVGAQKIDPGTVYEPIPGKEPVYWPDIAPDRMTEIAAEFYRRNPNGVLTFPAAARIFDRMGRPAGAVDMGKAEDAARVNAAMRQFGLDSWPQFSKKSAQDTARSQFRSAGIQVPMTQQEREAAMRAMDPKNRR